MLSQMPQNVSGSGLSLWEWLREDLWGGLVVRREGREGRHGHFPK